MIYFDGPADLLCYTSRTNKNATNYSSRGKIKKYDLNKEILSFIKDNHNGDEYSHMFEGDICGNHCFYSKDIVSYLNNEKSKELMEKILNENKEDNKSKDKIRIVVKKDLKEIASYFIYNQDINLAKDIFESSHNIKSVKIYKGRNLIKMMERD